MQTQRGSEGGSGSASVPGASAMERNQSRQKHNPFLRSVPDIVVASKVLSKEEKEKEKEKEKEREREKEKEKQKRKPIVDDDGDDLVEF